MILSLRGPVRVKLISIISCLKMGEDIMKKYIYMSIAVYVGLVYLYIAWMCLFSLYTVKIFYAFLQGGGDNVLN